ncbi:MAG TPA: mechanosensitive ion channel domain-containing protein [Rubrivivax sp.]|nr:mechanosensitive ion channel domain-containing protein [Rubrivivax sp.]
MDHRPLSPDELLRLVHSLVKPAALIELALVAGCLLLAWAVVLALRGRRPVRQGSIWFGDRILDGALFPLLALLLVLLTRWLVQTWWQEATPPAVFRLVLPVLMSLAVIRLTVRVLHLTFPDSPLMRTVERSISWLAWIAVVLWITGLLPLLMAELDTISWKVGASRISVRNVIEGGVSAVLVLMLALWLSSVLEARLLRGASHTLSLRKMAANALRALLLLVGLMFALSAAGIDLTALGVLGGALGVGIGLGLQRLAANYVSGFVILAERSVRIGDMIKVDNFEGRISDITTRYTVIRALNGRESIVPNEMLVTQRVENLSLADPKVSLGTTVQVAYGTDVAALLPQLTAAIARVPRVLANPEPTVQLSAFAADGLELNVGFWIQDPQNGQGNVRSEVNLTLLETLQQAGVEIPFPQRVLHRAPPVRVPPTPGA